MRYVIARLNAHRVAVLCAALLLLSFLFLNIPTAAGLYLWNHLKSSESAALAAWVAALATCALIGGLLLTKQSMKESVQSATFQRMYGQFNAPNMLYARAVFAKTHLERMENYGLGRLKDGYIPQQGWRVVNFLNLIGHQVQSERLSFDDVEIAYAPHVQHIVGVWKGQLNQEYREFRFKPLLDLYIRVEASPQPKEVKTEFDPLDKEFWESEACLDVNAKSEG